MEFQEWPVSAESRLSGKRILLVERTHLLSSFARRALEQMSAVIIGPVCRVSSAFEQLAGGEIDAAIVDITMNGEEAYAVSEMLMLAQVPFIFAFAAHRDLLPARFSGYCLSAEPMDLRAITEGLFGLPQ